MTRTEAASIYRRFRADYAAVAEKCCIDLVGGAAHSFKVACQDWLDDQARVINVAATPAQWAKAAEATYYEFRWSYTVRTSLDGGFDDWARERQDWAQGLGGA